MLSFLTSTAKSGRGAGPLWCPAMSESGSGSQRGGGLPALPDFSSKDRGVFHCAFPGPRTKPACIRVGPGPILSPVGRTSVMLSQPVPMSPFSSLLCVGLISSLFDPSTQRFKNHTDVLQESAFGLADFVVVFLLLFHRFFSFLALICIIPFILLPWALLCSCSSLTVLRAFWFSTMSCKDAPRPNTASMMPTDLPGLRSLSVAWKFFLISWQTSPLAWQLPRTQGSVSKYLGAPTYTCLLLVSDSKLSEETPHPIPVPVSVPGFVLWPQSTGCPGKCSVPSQPGTGLPGHAAGDCAAQVLSALPGLVHFCSRILKVEEGGITLGLCV